MRLIDKYDTYLFDLDGVVYVEDQVLPGSRECIAKLRELGKEVYFITNDPRPTRQELCDRLLSMEIPADVAEIVTSGWAAAKYLAERNITRAFVIGTRGLMSELACHGITAVDKEDCQAVLVGYDEGTTLRQIQQAVRYIERGARFIATNGDKSFPGQDGRCLATGTIVAAVREASGRRPTITGKPYSPIFHLLLSNIQPDTRAVMIGDSPGTDILGAHKHGLDAILVTTAAQSSLVLRDLRKPDAIIHNLIELFQPV